MMSFWQAAGLGALASLLGAAAIYLVLRFRHKRIESERGRKFGATSEGIPELGERLRSLLTHALVNAEQLDRSRRLGAEERACTTGILEAVSSALQRLNAGLRLAGMESGASAPAREAFDLHALLADLVSITGKKRNRSGKIRLRIDPKIPYRLVGDSTSVRMLLNALSASLPRAGGSIVVDVSLAHKKGSDVVVRFEVAHPTASGGVSHLPRDDDIGLAERIAGALGGKLEISRQGHNNILSFETAFAVETRAPSALADVGSARVLVVAREESTRERVTQVLGGDVNLMTVHTPGEAIKTLGRAIRLGDRVDAIIVEAEAASGDRNDHVELREKASSVQTPVYITADERGADDVMSSAYTGVLDLAGPREVIAQAIHAGISVQRVRASGPLVQVEPWAWGAGGGRPKRRILVVDDNVTNLLIVENILRSAGYDVDVARSGEEALTRLLGGSYRLAILDLHMPGMDGVTLLKRYRSLRPRLKIPIAFLTANTSIEATRECADAGADAFLTKPVVLDDLLNTVETLLKDSEVHWLPGSFGRAGEEREAASTPSLVDRQVVQELNQIYRDDAHGVTRVIETFRAEAEELLEGMALAASTNSLSSFKDQAHALWASAVNMGAAALAAECRDAKELGPVEFQRDGATTVRKLREAFCSTMTAFGELVEESES
jgi:two-component system sensor histidine kinase RpfC